MANTLVDLTGQMFGKLTVVSRAQDHVAPSGSKFVVWNCTCECGEVCTSWSSTLKKGQATSCGCVAAARLKEHREKHGAAPNNRRTTEYSIWSNMKQRIFNPKATQYCDYGGLGVTMHPSWVDSFVPFKQYLLDTIGLRPSLKHTLDRIDNNKGYEPGNLRWATKTEQLHNRRNIKTVERNLPLVAAKYGIPLDQLRSDIYG